MFHPKLGGPEKSDNRNGETIHVFSLWNWNIPFSKKKLNVASKISLLRCPAK
jgi:hypothetical protein